MCETEETEPYSGFLICNDDAENMRGCVGVWRMPGVCVWGGVWNLINTYMIHVGGGVRWSGLLTEIQKWESGEPVGDQKGARDTSAESCWLVVAPLGGDMNLLSGWQRTAMHDAQWVFVVYIQSFEGPRLLGWVQKRDRNSCSVSFSPLLFPPCW